MKEPARRQGKRVRGMVQGAKIDILSRRFILDAGDVPGCAMSIKLSVCTCQQTMCR